MDMAQAGTLESMDCIVAVTARAPGSGTVISITGSSSVRFKTVMEKKITEVLASLGAVDLDVAVQDNGAIDLVLGARVEAAVKKLWRTRINETDDALSSRK